MDEIKQNRKQKKPGRVLLVAQYVYSDSKQGYDAQCPYWRWRKKRADVIGEWEQNKVQHQINFLPDDIYLVPDDDLLDEIRMEEGEVLYKYRQFMIAKGYSEMWLNNPYIEL